MTSGTNGTVVDLERAIEAAIEGEIYEFANDNGARLLRRPETDSELVAKNIMALLQRVAGSSADDIDRLICEVQTLRETLQEQCARVQRELVEYASLSKSAMDSAKLIADRLAQWKKAGDCAPHMAPH
jgi:hypothetical protein